MKKLIIILIAILCLMGSAGAVGYTYRASRYEVTTDTAYFDYDATSGTYVYDAIFGTLLFSDVYNGYFSSGITSTGTATFYLASDEYLYIYQDNGTLLGYFNPVQFRWTLPIRTSGSLTVTDGVIDAQEGISATTATLTDTLTAVDATFSGATTFNETSTFNDGLTGTTATLTDTLTAADATFSGAVTFSETVTANETVDMNDGFTATTGSITSYLNIASSGDGSALIDVGADAGSYYNHMQLFLDRNGSNSTNGTHYFYRNLSSTATSGPLMYIYQDHASDDQPALQVRQDGSGDLLSLYYGASEVFEVQDDGTVTFVSGGTITNSGGTTKLGDINCVYIDTTGSNNYLYVNLSNVKIASVGAGDDIIFQGADDIVFYDASSNMILNIDAGSSNLTTFYYDIAMTATKKLTHPDGFHKFISYVAASYDADDAVATDISPDSSNGWLRCDPASAESVCWDLEPYFKDLGGTGVLDSLKVHLRGSSDTETVTGIWLYKFQPGSGSSTDAQNLSYACDGDWEEVELLGGDITLADDNFYWVRVDVSKSGGANYIDLAGVEIKWHTE